MTPERGTSEPTAAQLLAVIRIQNEIARSGLDLGDVMASVAQEAQALTGAAGAIVELVDGDEMVYRAVVGSADGQLGLRLSRTNSLSGRCVAETQALRCDDAESDPRVDREACLKVGLRSMVVVPLVHSDSAVGVLKVLSPAPAAFSEGDIKILSLMSDLIAAAMFHAARYGTDELFRRATRDGLTGLANRAFFFDRLRHCIAQARRKAHRLGILLLDMDGLKRHLPRPRGAARCPGGSCRPGDVRHETPEAASPGREQVIDLLALRARVILYHAGVIKPCGPCFSHRAETYHPHVVRDALAPLGVRA
jgi:putative methionine-R-sulfoxide reductase with GAF domain